MAHPVRSLAILAALAGGLYVVAGAQPTPSPPVTTAAPTVAKKQSAPAPKHRRPPVQQKSSAPAPRERATPIPKPRPPKAIVAPEKKRAPAKKARQPSAAHCAQLRLGLATIGRDGVIKEAKSRRFSVDQVDWAISACQL